MDGVLGPREVVVPLRRLAVVVEQHHVEVVGELLAINCTRSIMITRPMLSSDKLIIPSTLGDSEIKATCMYPACS
jgi:hypothetical protein